MTFIVDHNGNNFQKDLGAKAAQAAAWLHTFGSVPSRAEVLP